MKSIVTEFTEICAICGKPRECDHHLIFGQSLRALADQDKLILPMCNSCHNMSNHIASQIHDNSMAEALSKMVGQLAWEKNYYRMYSHFATDDRDIARMAFMQRYGKSWL